MGMADKPYGNYGLNLIDQNKCQGLRNPQESLENEYLVEHLLLAINLPCKSDSLHQDFTVMDIQVVHNFTTESLPLSQHSKGLSVYNQMVFLCYCL